MASGSNSRGLALLLITSCFFITGLLFDYMPMIVDDHIKRTVELATNEEVISFWSRPPVDLHSYYWLYEVVNPEQFSNGEKIQVRKVGPFHFTSRMEKRVVELSQNKYRVTYNSTRFSSLDETFGNSAELLDEKLSLINPLYGAISEGVRAMTAEADAQQRNLMVSTLNKIMERFNETLVVRLTPREALVGIQMPIIKKLTKMAQTFGMEGGQIPDLGTRDGLFGYVAIRNGTWSGPFEIYTGYQETAKSMGELISYKGKRRLTYYEGKCNRLQASVGELRPMPIDPRQTLELFNPSSCRIVQLKPTGVQKMREGLAIGYVIAPESLASAEQNPDNRCYCTSKSSPSASSLEPSGSNMSLMPVDDHCSLNGVIDLAPCSFNAPFLLATSSVPLDQRIMDTIKDFEAEMLRGDVDSLVQPDDKVQLLILKRIGVPVHADITMTLLMKVLRDPAFRHTANVPPVTYAPLMTVRETVSIPPKLAQIIVNLESFLALTYHIKVIMYLSAIVLLWWLTGHYYCKTSKQGERVGPAGGPGPGADRAGGLAGGLSKRAEQAADPQQDRQSGGGVPGERATAAPPDADRSEGAPGDQLGQLASAGRQVAPQTVHDTASSERANSADSNRSLPPSRQASHLGSIDAGTNLSVASDERSVQTTAPPMSPPAEPAGPSARGDVDGDDKALLEGPPPPLEGGQRALPGADGAPLPTGASWTEQGGAGGAVGRPARPFGARIFSKVDDELMASQSGRAEGAPEVGGPMGGAGGELAAAAGDKEGRVGQTAGGRKRRGWFVNVCSNFVRLLSGLRTTISEAGKLDLGENDYQDKQLEMLAGKIDNWYVETSAPRAAAEPEASASELEVSAGELEASASKLEASYSQPKASNSEPAGHSERPEEEQRPQTEHFRPKRQTGAAEVAGAPAGPLQEGGGLGPERSAQEPDGERDGPEVVAADAGDRQLGREVGLVGAGLARSEAADEFSSPEGQPPRVGETTGALLGAGSGQTGGELEQSGPGGEPGRKMRAQDGANCGPADEQAAQTSELAASDERAAPPPTTVAAEGQLEAQADDCARPDTQTAEAPGGAGSGGSRTGSGSAGGGQTAGGLGSAARHEERARRRKLQEAGGQEVGLGERRERGAVQQQWRASHEPEHQRQGSRSRQGPESSTGAAGELDAGEQAEGATSGAGPAQEEEESEEEDEEEEEEKLEGCSQDEAALKANTLDQIERVLNNEEEAPLVCSGPDEAPLLVVPEVAVSGEQLGEGPSEELGGDGRLAEAAGPEIRVAGGEAEPGDRRPDNGGQSEEMGSAGLAAQLAPEAEGGGQSEGSLREQLEGGREEKASAWSGQWATNQSAGGGGQLGNKEHQSGPTMDRDGGIDESSASEERLEETGEEMASLGLTRGGAQSAGEQDEVELEGSPNGLSKTKTRAERGFIGAPEGELDSGKGDVDSGKAEGETVAAFGRQLGESPCEAEGRREPIINDNSPPTAIPRARLNGWPLDKPGGELELGPLNGMKTGTCGAEKDSLSMVAGPQVFLEVQQLETGKPQQQQQQQQQQQLAPEGAGSPAHSLQQGRILSPRIKRAPQSNHRTLDSVPMAPDGQLSSGAALVGATAGGELANGLSSVSVGRKVNGTTATAATTNQATAIRPRLPSHLSTHLASIHLAAPKENGNNISNEKIISRNAGLMSASGVARVRQQQQQQQLAYC